jgi:hypothetical protein
MYRRMMSPWPRADAYLLKETVEKFRRPEG